MEADIFKDIIVPVVGGLGIFLLGLEFMANGIQALSVNRMREWLGKIAGTPIKGVLAGTVITGVIQSSTAMTVMVVGLVNAGVIALRPAISVIMGANIGTTLGNGLIALPLGPLGLLCGGFFALVYVFAKADKLRNIALACMGFALIFYGLNLMIGGLRPLRAMPEVMTLLSGLHAETFASLIACIAVAALVTALIHSSSATIGIVMGLGAAGVLEWHTAIAFALGAELGTTITSWMASLNLSKNAKRAAYAHIAFNFIGVGVMLLLFFPAIELLRYVMGWFGGDPGVPVMVHGRETFPLVPVAVGIFSIAFNIFNTLLLFPFVSVFEHVLSRIGRTAAEDIEDYSTPRFLRRELSGDFPMAVDAVQRETRRHLEAAALFLAIARRVRTAPSEPGEHHVATDILSRDIRAFSSTLFRTGMPYEQQDLIASLIEEADFTASLAETLHQVARRVKREKFGPEAEAVIADALQRLDVKLRDILPGSAAPSPQSPEFSTVEQLREKTLRLGPEVTNGQRGAILALLGSIERAELLIRRIDAEHKSVNRAEIIARARQAKTKTDYRPDMGGNLSPQPAE
ncbi:MAG: Na/Pi cotransporter family protein [Parvibaculaceae bacterium]